MNAGAHFIKMRSHPATRTICPIAKQQHFDRGLAAAGDEAVEQGALQLRGPVVVQLVRTQLRRRHLDLPQQHEAAIGPVAVHTPPTHCAQLLFCRREEQMCFLHAL